jgi:hypothetical protein
MASLNGARRGATRTCTFRAGGSADPYADRTVRRWTPCRRANSRTESPSTRASLRIVANRSTVDLIKGPLVRIIQTRTRSRAAHSNPRKAPGKSETVEPHVAVTPGPYQAVITKCVSSG